MFQFKKTGYMQLTKQARRCPPVRPSDVLKLNMVVGHNLQHVGEIMTPPLKVLTCTKAFRTWVWAGLGLWHGVSGEFDTLEPI